MTRKKQANLFNGELLEGSMSGYRLTLRPLVDHAPGDVNDIVQATLDDIGRLPPGKHLAHAVVFAVLPLVFSLLLSFQDTAVSITEQDRRMLFQVMITAACVSIGVGIAFIMSIYLSLHLPSVPPDHNLITSWELGFESLGFSGEEALDRVNLGYMWHAMLLINCMACVVGGKLFVEVHRLGRAEELSEAAAGGAPIHCFPG